ncbi:MAG: MotA/TolQ/ExbB proton channel family protein [bacterium]|jgi:biopolymer transport protein ExbB
MTKYRFVCVMGIIMLCAGVTMAQADKQPAPRAATGMGQQTGTVVTSKETTGTAPDMRDLTMIQLLQKGGPVMYPLYLCSILALGFAFERLFTLRNRVVSPPQTVLQLRTALDQPGDTFNAQALQAQLEGATSPLARIVAAGIRRANRPIMEVEKAMEDTAAKEVSKLQRNNRVLSAVASVAPLLGLLGTATGIIRTFMTVAASEDALGRTELLAGGIYEALVATAVGLTIAIAALVMYFFFQERVERLVSEIDYTATELAEKLASKS